MKVIMLAAGVGKRMSAVTDVIPKCLIKIGEKTLLERHLEIIKEDASSNRRNTQMPY